MVLAAVVLVVVCRVLAATQLYSVFFSIAPTLVDIKVSSYDAVLSASRKAKAASAASAAKVP